MLEKILSHYEENDRPVLDVGVLEPEGGTLVFLLTEGTTSAVYLTGAEGPARDFLEEGIHVRAGQSLRASRVLDQLDWINRHAFRSARVLTSPGELPGEAELLFQVQEENPWSVSLGYENEGNPGASGHRSFLAGSLLLPGQDWLSWQLTVGESWRELHAFGLVYDRPFAASHHHLRFSALYAGLERSDGVSRAGGESFLLSAEYGIPLARRSSFRHEFKVGIDLKMMDNFFLFQNVPLPLSDVTVLQGRFGYQGFWEGNKQSLGFSLASVFSPGGLLSNNDDVDFEAYRPGADSSYFYFVGRLDYERELARDWFVRVRAEGQWSAEPLLPTEQFLLGGVRRGRGVREARFLGDSGGFLSSELRSPTSKVGRWQGQGLTFVEAGWVDQDFQSDELFSVGLGLRVEWNDWLALRVDQAWELDSGESRLHFGCTLTW